MFLKVRNKTFSVFFCIHFLIACFVGYVYFSWKEKLDPTKEICPPAVHVQCYVKSFLTQWKISLCVGARVFVTVGCVCVLMLVRVTHTQKCWLYSAVHAHTLAHTYPTHTLTQQTIIKFPDQRFHKRSFRFLSLTPTIPYSQTLGMCFVCVSEWGGRVCVRGDLASLIL